MQLVAIPPSLQHHTGLDDVRCIECRCIECRLTLCLVCLYYSENLQHFVARELTRRKTSVVFSASNAEAARLAPPPTYTSEKHARNTPSTLACRRRRHTRVASNTRATREAYWCAAAQLLAHACITCMRAARSRPHTLVA